MGLGTGVRVLAVCAVFQLFPAPAAIAQDAAVLLERYEQAEAHRTGDGAPLDPALALKLHQDLVAEGYRRSLVRVGALALDAGMVKLAVDSFSQAAENGSSYAAARLAEGHANGRFGDASRPEHGFGQLVVLAEATGDRLTRYYLAKAHEDGAGTTPDPARAIEIYAALSADGYGLASARLATIHQDGIGVEPDPARAVSYLEKAVDDGYDYALLKLARAYMDAGRQQDALRTIDLAAGRGVKFSETQRATWHANRDFGPLSDRAFGRRELKRLAESGDLYAARLAMQQYEKYVTRNRELDLDKVLGLLHEASASGDGTATGILARAYRKLPWRIPNAREKHAALIESHGDQLPVRLKLPEELQAIYDPYRTRQSRDTAYEMLQAATDEGYFHGLVRLWSIERTAYVYVVQHELKDMGMYAGATTGYLNWPTIRAIFALCREEGIYDVCRHGPISYQSTTLVARALYERRTGM